MDMPKPHSKPIRLLYFWAGIIATLVYRLIIILNFYSPAWVKIAWYVGTIGFIVYFWHRYRISETRSRLIREQGLAGKVSKMNGLTEPDRQAFQYILSTLVSTKEKWNYIAIFVFSGLALIVGVILDLVVKP